MTDLTAAETEARDAVVWRFDRMRSWMPDDAHIGHMLSVEKALTEQLDTLIEASRVAGVAAYLGVVPCDEELCSPRRGCPEVALNRCPRRPEHYESRDAIKAAGESR